MSLNIMDMHCDTLMKAMLENKQDIYENAATMVDVKRLSDNGYLAQFFAIFVVPETMYREGLHMDPIPSEECILRCHQIFEHTMQQHEAVVSKATTVDRIMENAAKGKLSAVLTMEDGVAVDGQMENLDRFYDMGVRALALTWNYENCFGYPNSRETKVMAQGLKPFGKEAVAYMQDKGILVDVSHLSDGGFYDVADIAKKPFIASHSNCRELSNHPRNLTDDMLKILGNTGGVTGLNFCPSFLTNDAKNKESSVEMIVAMAKHMKQIGGVDIIGVGTDFDGVEGNLEISGCEKMNLLADGLSRNGFTTGEIEKIMSGNLLRAMREAVK